MRLDAARQELATAHAAQVAALEAAAAEQLEAVRRDAETALATREAELKAHAAEQVEMAARGARDDAGRAAVDTAQQHDAALAAVQAQLEDAEARRVQLEEDLPVRLDAARRELAAAHVAQVAALEAATAEQLEAVRRDAETALATREAELKAHAAEQVEMAAREARDDAGRAAADTAQQHDAALAAVRAQLEDAEARRVQLEEDLPARVEAVRQELAAAHGVQVAALETRAAGRLEAVRRDAETALATREAELKAHAAEQVEMAARGARDDAGRAAVAAAQQHDAALAAVRAQLEDVEVGRVQLEQDLPVRVAAMRRETDAAHAVQVAALEARATAQLEAARRDAETALAAQETKLEGHAAARIGAAVRAARAEAAQMLAEAVKEHHVALARLRAERQTDATQAEDQLAELQQQFTDRVEAETATRIEAAVREAHDDAVRVAAEGAQQRDAEARAEVARAKEGMTEAEQTLGAIRKEADMAQAEVRRLRAERANQHEHRHTLVKAKVGARRAAAADTHAISTKSKSRSVTPRGMAEVAGALVLAGFTGTLIGWFVAF